MAMAPPNPAGEMNRLLGVVEGRWDLAVTYAPSPFLPDGGEARGNERTYSGPGGYSAVIDAVATGPGAFEFKGIGAIVWDSTEVKYKLYWFSSISPTASLFDGEWEGEDLTFVGRENILGQTLSSRHRLSNIEPDAFDYAIDLGPSPDRLERAITIRYTRASQ